MINMKVLVDIMIEERKMIANMMITKEDGSK
jgi:hypothetical protein